MNLFLAFGTYFIVWWLCFFMVLPLGAQSAHEAGEALEAGLEAGAPRAHKLGRKALFAAGLAAIVWAGGYWALASGLVKLFY